jgi:hypothetical protein
MEIGTRFLGTLLAAAALVAGPLVGDLAAGGCEGCYGKTNHADSSLASCFQSPMGAWQISVAYDISPGSCTAYKEGLSLVCDPEPCSGTVTYSWGGEVAAGITEIGYQLARPTPQPRTTLGFAGEPPWKAGESGSVSFGPDSDPVLECGRVYSFFISGDTCGPIQASVWASCTTCGISF